MPTSTAPDAAASAPTAKEIICGDAVKQQVTHSNGNRATPITFISTDEYKTCLQVAIKELQAQDAICNAESKEPDPNNLGQLAPTAYSACMAPALQKPAKAR